VALIPLDVASKISAVESIEQMTLQVAEDIVPGAPVRVDPATGKFTNSNGTDAAEARTYGIAVGSHTIQAGLAVTAVRRGVLSGFAFSQAYDAPIYVSDTDGRLGDASGTVSVVAGRVIPVPSELLGIAFGKLLLVNL